MSILQNGIVPASAVEYTIDNSLRLNDNDSAYLSRTPSSAGNRKTWTWSGWVKLGNIDTVKPIFMAGDFSNGSPTGQNGTGLLLYSNGVFYTYWDNAAGGTTTSSVYRDPSAWYHIVISADAQTAGTMKLYINGEEVSSKSISGDAGVNYTNTHTIGTYPTGTTPSDMTMAEVNFIDGQALDPSNFGETGDYGEWKPIEYTGTYGTNGFYLDFENSGSLGADVSGNGNNWTPTNLAATDQMLDSPTNNFATMNPVDKGDGAVVFVQGNLRVNVPDNGEAFGTFGMSSGKWYWENYYDYSNSNNYKVGMGIADADGTSETINYGHQAPTYVIGDIIGIAVDADAQTIEWFKNNVSMGSPTSYSYTTAKPLITSANSAGNEVVYTNFGQDSSFAGNKTAQGNTDGNGYGDFYYTPPSGFLALCTQNLPDPTVIPSEHFNTVLYTGDGTTGHAITGTGFQPDLVWLKGRSYAEHHNLTDAVRGVNKTLYSNRTEAEATSTTYLQSFDSDGFTIGHNHEINNNGSTFVAWNWKANGSGSSNTNGTITSTVSANQDAGFSIVSYTGTGVDDATVGHGLSKAPEMVIIKNRIDALHWFVHHQYHGATPEYRYRLLLNTTGARTYDTGWLEANPTATVFQLGTSGYTNGVSDDMIAYCFHSVDGFSKVGSYTGNGSTDGTFVYTGFRPAYVMIKRTNDYSHWEIHDTAREPYNVKTKLLNANQSNAEDNNSNSSVDFISNGFKLRTLHAERNQSGGSFIFLAFAETPFKHSNGA